MADPKLSKSRLEALLALASGSVAQPVSGLAGLYALARGKDGAKAVADTQQALTYAPRDTRGLQEIAQAISPVTSRLEGLKHYLGDKAEAHGASPLGATAAYMVPDTLLTLLGARGMGVKGPKLAQMLERSEGPTMGAAQSQQGVIGFHGTNAVFDHFDAARIGSATDEGHLGQGFYASTDPRVAEGSQHQMRVDVDLQNPLEIQMPDWRTDKRTLVRDALGLPHGATAAEVHAAAVAKGHDGVVLDYSPAGYAHQELVAFTPEQMKLLERSSKAAR